MVIGVVSAKGSPGVSTTALALCAAVDPAATRLLVELDPSGGSIECWTGPVGEPGLIQLANGLRRGVGPEALLTHAVAIAAGVWAVLAPAAGALAEATVAASGDRLVPALATVPGTVVVDGGRWSRSQPTASRLAGCDVVAVVCRPTVAGVEAARWLIDPLAATVSAPVVLVLVGDRPYGPEEVADAVGVPVVGALAWDPRGVTALLTAGAGRTWTRSSIARSARSVLAALHSHAHPSPAVGEVMAGG